MLDPNQIKDLEHYANRNLSRKERKAIEERMQQDADYNQEAQEYIDIYQGFGGLAIENLEGQMQNWEKKHQQQGAKVVPMRSSFARYMAAAAAVLLVVSLGYLGLQQMLPTTSEDLFAQHFDAPQNVSIMDMTFRNAPDLVGEGDFETETTTTAAEEEEDIDAAGLKIALDKGISAYNTQKYEDASKYFTAYLDGSKTPNSQEVKLYLGIAYLAQHDVERATPLFKDLMSESGFRSDAEWYLALTYLRANKIKKAKRLLKQIDKKPNHRHKQKAQKLQEKMAKHDIQ